LKPPQKRYPSIPLVEYYISEALGLHRASLDRIREHEAVLLSGYDVLALEHDQLVRQVMGINAPQTGGTPSGQEVAPSN